MQLVRIQQITEHIPCFTFSPDNWFHYSNAHPQGYSVKSPSWDEGSGGGENKQRSIKTGPPSRIRGWSRWAQRRAGGSGDGVEVVVEVGWMRRGVLARAAALGDRHLRLLLQFDVDHWGSFVKRLHCWICAYRLWNFLCSVCCHGNLLPVGTFCAQDKAALWQSYEKDTILFALLWRAVHPRQRRGNATEQLKANQRTFSEVLGETRRRMNRAGSSSAQSWAKEGSQKRILLNIFYVSREARFCLNANTRFSCLRCLYEFRSPNPTAKQTVKSQQQKRRRDSEQKMQSSPQLWLLVCIRGARLCD